MSFSIDLPGPIKQKIANWNLSSRLINEILEHLYEELAEKPLAYLHNVPEPAGHLQYSFIVLADGDPPRDYLFEFSIRYRADEETLVIFACDYLQIESGPEAPREG
jgi:hypothetical protein